MGFAGNIKRNVIVRASVAVALITLATKVLGYAEKITVAYYWGTGSQADAYYAVSAILIGVAVLFREVLEPGMLNTLLQVRESRGARESWRVFVSLFAVVALAGGILSLGLGAGAGPSVHLFLSGFEGERLQWAVRFMQFGSIALFLLICCTVTNTYLLSYKRFTSIALSEFAFKGAILLVLLSVGNRYGIAALIAGLVAGAAVKFAIQLVRMRPDGFWRDWKPSREYVRAVLWLSWPLLVGNFFSQLGTIADNTFASYLSEGVISSLALAKKVIDLPVILFPYTLSVVVFPFFSQLSVEKDTLRLDRLFNRTLGYIVLFFLPVMLFIASFPEQIIRLIFERGAFGSDSTAMTAELLSVYNAGIVAFALETVLVIFLFAQNRIKTAVVIGIGCVVLDIAITGLFIGRFNYLAIAWAFVIAKWVKVILLLCFTRRNLHVARRKVWRNVAGIGSALVVFMLPLWICSLPVADVQGTVPLAMWLAAVGSVGFGAYAAVLIGFKIVHLGHGQERE